MSKQSRLYVLVLLCLFLAVWNVPRAAAADWDPVTDAEKNMISDPLNPGSGAVVLFKRGDLHVVRENTSLWVTKMVTYTRIKILTEAGRDAGNVEIEAPKFLRLSKVEGRTDQPEFLYHGE